MYDIVIDVPIDLVTHFINVIQKVNTKKKTSLPFGGFITRIEIIAKVPLHDSESIIKMYGKIPTLTVVKSKVVVSKK
jgi:hypothetical protein